MARRNRQSRIAGKQMAEAGAASFEVISSRLLALSDPGGLLSPRQQREVGRMIGEKLAAGMDGWVAAGIEMSLMPYRVLQAMSRPPASVAEGVASWLDLWMGVGNAAMRPARRTVLANRKRLGRASRRRTAKR